MPFGTSAERIQSVSYTHLDVSKRQIVMSLTAPLLMGLPLVPGSVLANILIAFVLACIINLILPIPLIAVGVPKALKMNPESLGGRIVGNIPICLIFVLIIGLILNLYNVRQVPAFIFAFAGTFVPLYLVCCSVSMITNQMCIRDSG